MTTALVAQRQRLTWLLLAGQSLSSAGIIASVTVATLVGAELSGRPELAGLPGAVYGLGAALAAYPAARLMERAGRRPGLTLGFSIGALGALGAGLAVLSHSFLPFLLCYGLVGLARGANDLARYAAAEMHPPSDRARAISLVVLGGTVGAIAGPLLVGPTGHLASQLGGNPLAGPWFASLALFSLGALLMNFFLRPDPQAIGREFDALADRPAPSGPVRSWPQLLRDPAVLTALVSMTIGQMVMVMVMAITPLYMRDHQHGLGDISLVIMAHTLGMYGLSTLTGRLTDTWGRAPAIMTGAAILMAACLFAPVAQTTGLLALALFLLGLGWNFCYVAGAALLTDALTPVERGRTQGGTDLFVGLVSAAGNLGSGAVFAVFGFALMGWISLAVCLAPLALAARHYWRPAVKLPDAGEA